MQTPFLVPERWKKIQEIRLGQGDIGENVERSPFPVLFISTQNHAAQVN
jgi:hypothetical protein